MAFFTFSSPEVLFLIKKLHHSTKTWINLFSESFEIHIDKAGVFRYFHISLLNRKCPGSSVGRAVD
ncbi:MAG: hypothetical protein C0602_10695 [Denitrovibrio sp.]|nr:MAG: hypothetical protein C0602_10695 [Denitrovibrio sp.]